MSMNDIEKAIKDARAAQVGRIYGTFQNAKEVTVDENGIQKADDGEVEKSDIMNALSYQGEIKVSKTGKEIKQQVDDVLLPDLNAKLAVKEEEATKKLADCGDAPTRDVDPWWTGDVKMDVGYKVYSWSETCYDEENANDSVAGSLSGEEKKKEFNCPESKEEADCRRCYNDIVRAICNIKVDIKACEILKELKDGTTYDLTPRQVLALRF